MPQIQHMTPVMRILRYLKDTNSQSLLFGKMITWTFQPIPLQVGQEIAIIGNPRIVDFLLELLIPQRIFRSSGSYSIYVIVTRPKALSAIRHPWEGMSSYSLQLTLLDPKFGKFKHTVVPIYWRDHHIGFAKPAW